MRLLVAADPEELRLESAHLALLRNDGRGHVQQGAKKARFQGK